MVWWAGETDLEGELSGRCGIVRKGTTRVLCIE
jgi:hypothetical protein